MKRLLISFVIIVLLFACEGPTGPEGPEGVPGEEGFVFDYEFSFVAPEYSVLLELPENFDMTFSDVILVYLLWEVTEDNVEVWRLLPQTLYIDEGILQYNYDWTVSDARVFLDGTAEPNLLGAFYTDNWIARLVVVPAQPGGRLNLDYSDYNQIKEFYDLPHSKLATKSYQKRP